MTEVIRNQKTVETLFIDIVKATEQEMLPYFTAWAAYLTFSPECL
jgi:hypothetical protein